MKSWLDAMTWGLAQFPESDVRHHELMAFLFWKLSQRYSSNAEHIRQLNRSTNRPENT